MTVRRLRAGLRGWGGVGAMAVALALTAVFGVVVAGGGPLTRAGRHAGAAPGASGSGAAQATQAKAGTCKDSTVQNLSPSPSSADGPTIEDIKKRKDRRLIIGVDQNSYRWGYRNPNSGSADLEGFDIDLAHRIAKEILGDPNAIQFRAIPTNQRIPAIQQGQVDMVVRTMTITCTRLDQVAFSAPYFATGQQVLAPRNSSITGFDKSLGGKKVCSAKTSTASAALEAGKKDGRIPRDTDITTAVPNQLDCLVKLQLGEVDAVVTDGALAASQAAQDPTLKLEGDPFTTEYYGVAMRKPKKSADDDLLRRVNQILADYRTDGGWQAAYKKWLLPTLGADSASATPPKPEYD
ncbi:ABC-type transporter, periplasmic subunit family 3 [Actinobacteria bacterium OK074]|nr:ABC-type transporter, periplasmic subunit family 3 [Actinobacteria bacterium OK074]